MRKWILCLLILSLVTGLTVPAAAAEVDMTRQGSVTVLMQWEEAPLDTGTLSLCRVAKIREASFELLPQLADSGLSLKDLNDSALAAALAQLAAQKGLETVTADIRNGRAHFEDLPLGLYLVVQETACEGFAPINPFLLSVPRQEGGDYVYDVTGNPKVGLEPLPTEPTKPTQTQPTKPTDPKLPQTGQLNWPVPAMACAGAALLLLGVYLCFGKKRCYEK